MTQATSTIRRHEPDDVAFDEALLRSTLRLNALLFGLLLGVLTGLLLLAFALGLGALADEQRRFAAGLLSIFLPGYGTGAWGALAGFAWGVIDGALVGTAVYWLHGRSVLAAVDRRVRIDANGATEGIPRAVLRLHGPAFGAAIGLIAAGGLVVTTNWLVLRGTALESVHARLLGEILPGYAVAPVGSLIGAVELFAIVFVLGWLFAAIYNRVASRSRRPRSAKGVR